MSAPRRGSVWSTNRGRDVLVVSSTIYNEIGSEATVLTTPVVGEEPESGFGVDLGSGWALPNLIGPFRKSLLDEQRHQVAMAQLTAVNNMLFKILATPEK